MLFEIQSKADIDDSNNSFSKIKIGEYSVKYVKNISIGSCLSICTFGIYFARIIAL